MEIHPRVLQDIDLKGPLPKKGANMQMDGIGIKFGIKFGIE